MNLDIQSLIQSQKIFISPKQLTNSILQKRFAKVSAKKPSLYIVFLHPVISFFWLFCVFASFFIAVLSLTLVGRIAAATIYRLLPIFLTGSFGIPLLSSIVSLKKRQKQYRTQLASCYRDPITEVEISEYFEEYRTKFLLEYQEYVDFLNNQFSLLSNDLGETETRLSSDIARLQELVTDTINRLEGLKNTYLSRLNLLEIDFIEHLNRGREEFLLESVAQFELVLDRLQRETDIANTYLEAVEEVDK